MAADPTDAPEPGFQPLDRCSECGFDAEQWNDTDTIRTLRLARPLLDLWTTPLSDEQLNLRVAPDRWSPAEYIGHVGDTLGSMSLLVELATLQPGIDLGPAVEPVPAGDHQIHERRRALALAGSEALSQQLTGLDRGRWETGVVLGEKVHTIRWGSRHALHDLWHHLIDIALLTAELDCGLAPHQGRLERINVSEGGVPKTSVAEAGIGPRGVDGDRQASRVHHGRPWQALCLWSSEVIEALRTEGHPVEAGATGENLTVSGLDWATLHAGAVIEIGAVTCQLTATAEPCTQINRSFTEGNSRRIDHGRHPGWSRWYASVVTPGRVVPGAQVRVRRPTPADIAPLAPLAPADASAGQGVSPLS